MVDVRKSGERATPMHIVAVQNSFLAVIHDVQAAVVPLESFWVSRRANESAEQELYYVEVTKQGNEVRLVGEGIEFVKGPHKNAFSWIAAIGDQKYVLQAAKSWKRADSVVALAATADRLITGTTSGTLAVYDWASETYTKRVADAHAGDIRHIRVFPSLKVVLTVGIDLQMKIWLVDDESPRAAQTLHGHTQEITAVELVGRGRNFLTGSLDGSVGLWECGLGSLVHSFRRIDDMTDPVNCIATSELSKPWSISEPLSDKEFDTVGRELLVGYESGVIQGFDVGYHSQLRRRMVAFAGVAVTALATSGAYTISGYRNGHVVVWQDDAVKMDIALAECPVSLLLVTGADPLELVVANGPDTTLRLHLDPETASHTVTYLAGLPELFVPSSIAGNGQLFFACDKSGVATFAG